MKALLLHRPGDDYALTLADVPTPTPGPGEVRLRVRASSINPVDHKFARSGAGLALPHVLGIDAAGEIDALGPEVQGWRLGDRVMALTNLYRWGGFAEQFIVDALRDAGARYLFIDTAPSIGSVNAELFALADLILIPLNPQTDFMD